MDSSYERALQTLEATGRVTVPGASARWSRGASRMLIAAIAMVVVLGIGSVAVAVASGGAFAPPGAIAGVVGVLVMLAIAAAVLLAMRTRHGAFAGAETNDVVLDERGLTLRGVGPIPWQDFGFAEHRMVPAEHTSGYMRRAVMPLTASGLFNVNERLPEERRRLLSPPMGPVWNRRHEWIYVPGVAGLRAGEVMDLINAAHRMYPAAR